jgi:predicted acylesterase/phospholipase RssA
VGIASRAAKTGTVLVQLPLGFLVPLIVLVGGWTFFLFKESIVLFKGWSSNLKEALNPLTAIPIASRVDDILIATFVILIYVVGLLVAYNLSVLINGALVRYGMKPVSLPNAHPHRPSGTADPGDPFQNVHKIGLVLAGGGAKGAFQAGAMKAIYQFLAEHGALDKLKVISGTSIGSWNAMFWLGDLIASDNGWDQRSVHESWWRSINLRSLIAPSWYWPGLRNAFFVTGPWQALFDRTFGQDEVRKRIVDSKIHFYFTRSDVRSGKLQCTTNNQNPCQIPKIRYTCLDPSKSADKFMDGVKFGVFASMDLPPLFPYMRLDDNLFEDGGVIDNLPVLFAAMEECDLIFILPLNSDFTSAPNQRSVLRRLLRVMDVRQGALERGGLKELYLYNEIAVLRDYALALRAKAIEAKIELPPVNSSQTLQYALKRTHQLSKIFAVCPLRTFVEDTINTQELWKSKGAGRAFDVMYRATREVLSSRFDPNQERIKVALVDGAENITWDEHF